MRKNWLTSVGGILAGASTAVLTSGLTLPPTYQHFFAALGALGVAIVGIAAKGQDEHSTSTQVALSTAAADAKAPNS